MNAQLRAFFLLLVVAAATLTTLAGCAAGHGYRLRAVPYPDYTIEDGTATIKTETFRISVVPLDELARAAFIKARAASGIDPFQCESNGTPRYLTFKLTVQNLTAKDTLTFQPQNILLASENGDRIYPLDYPQAYTRLAGSVSSDPRLLEDLSKYLFDIGVSVPPDGRTEGLLVYPAAKSGTTKLRLEVSFIQINGQSSSTFDIIFLKEPAI